MGVKISYGRCQGGPYNKKDLAHHGEVFRVAIDKHTRKAIPAMVTSAQPDIEFGEYHFVDGGWVWKE